jgi:transcription elongation factor GreA
VKDKKIYLTQEGLDELKAELDDLINVQRPRNIVAIKEARALGDLSENADYDAAKNEQAEIEGRIKKIEKMLENVEIINEAKTDKVSIGSTVSVKYVDDDDTDEYKIVGSQEADPFMSKISNESPIAKAILNKKVGDIVEVDSPNGVYKIEITEIKYKHFIMFLFFLLEKIVF